MMTRTKYYPNVRRYFLDNEGRMYCRFCIQLLDSNELTCSQHGYLGSSRRYRKQQYRYELQEAINNVRVRDNNTCQWYHCDTPTANVQVNHIFPVSEYPHLSLVERYMICYCERHHKYWHDMRDKTRLRGYKIRHYRLS